MSSDRQTTSVNGTAVAAPGEVERLRADVSRLEKERDEYRAILCRTLAAQVRPEDVIHTEEGGGQTLDQFLPELEALVARATSEATP